MLIENLDALKIWLKKTLTPICDADPNTLSQYVVALLKKNKSDKDLKDFCLDQLDVFLQQKTKGFVETLFESLTSKSYENVTPPLPPPPPTMPTVVAPPPPPTEPVPTPAVLTPVSQNQPIKTDKRKKSEETHEDGDKDNHRRQSASPTSRGRGRDGDRDDRRRRPYDDRNRFPNERRYPRYGEDFNRRRSRSRSPRNRAWGSQNRVRGRSPDRSRSPYPRGRSRSRSRSYSPGQSRSPRGRRPEPDSRGSTPIQDNGKYSTEPDIGPGPVSVPSAITVVSRSAADKRYDWNQQTGRNTPPVNVPPPPPGRPRCKDYDEKGFCMRGDLCPYDHGLDPVVVEDISIPPVLPFPPGPPPPPGMPGMEPMPPGAGPRMAGPRMSGPRMSGPRMSGPRMPGQRMSGPPMSGPRMSGPRPRMSDPRPRMSDPRMADPRPPSAPPGGSGPRGPRPSRPGHENFQPEGYNPEAPAINLPRPQPGFWTGPRGPRPPPPFHNQPPPPPPPMRGRDLVQVQTVPEPSRDDEPPGLVVPAPSQGNDNSRTVVAPKRPYEKMSQPSPPSGGQSNLNQFHTGQPPVHNRYPGPPPKRHFDFNRLGSYRQTGFNTGFNPENATLEVRKVPKEFNTIAKLNEHFGKFGTLVNIQVSYDGDTEAALITYSRNAEANGAYRSSEPVFNNRFIKLFWHKEKPTTQQQQPGAGTSQHNQEMTVEDHRIPIKSRLGAIPSPEKMQLNNLIPKPSQTPEKSLIYTSTVGSLTKTVFNPAALKNLTSPTSVNPPDLSTHRKVEEQTSIARKQETLKKRLELQKQKQQLLQKYIEQQKLLLGKVEKSKNMTAEDKGLLMKTIKDLSKKIDNLKTELMPKKTSPESFKSEAQAKKEILDTELELMTKQHAGDDTSDLKQRLADLTREAAAMGLLPKGRGRGRGMPITRGRGRAFTTWSRGGRGARGRGFAGHTGANRTLDRRPKQLKVSGFTVEDKNDLLLHLAQHGEVENIDFNDPGQNAMVTFKTRMDAEKVALNANQFKGKSLVMKWHTPGIGSTSLSLSDDALDDDDDADDDVGVVEEEELDEDALLAPDDEEDDDEESRSWRR